MIIVIVAQFAMYKYHKNTGKLKMTFFFNIPNDQLFWYIKNDLCLTCLEFESLRELKQSYYDYISCANILMTVIIFAVFSRYTPRQQALPITTGTHRGIHPPNHRPAPFPAPSSCQVTEQIKEQPISFKVFWLNSLF